MAGTERPRPLSALSLAAVLAFGAGPSLASDQQLAMVGAPTITLNSGTVMQARGELQSLNEDLLAHLRGKKKASVADLEKRLKRVEAMLAEGSMLASEQAKVRDDVKKVSALLESTKSLTLGGSGRPNPQVTALVEAVSAGPKQGDGATVAALVGGLRDAAADPSQAARIFENLQQRLGGLPDAQARLAKVQKGLAESPIEFADPRNPNAQSGKPKDPDLSPPAPGVQGAVKNVKGPGLSDAAEDAASPFLNLLPDAKERLFTADRLDKRRSLLRGAREAILTSHGDPDAFIGLPSLIAHLEQTRGFLLETHGIKGPAKDAAEEQRRMKVIAETNMPLALYMVDMAMYKVFLQQAFLSQAIPVGTVFEAWEVGAPAEPLVTKIVFSAQQESGAVFLGFQYHYKDGTSRFQGQGRDDDSALSVARSPVTGKEIRTRAFFDAERQLRLAQPRIIDEQTGRVLREEFADIAKKVTRIKVFNPDGSVETKVEDNGGVRTMTDFNRGTEIATSEDRSTKITNLNLGKTDAPQYKFQYGTLNDDGSIAINRIVLGNDNSILILSPHVNKIIDPKGKFLPYDISLTGLLKTARGEERAKAGRALAEELLKILGVADQDGTRKVALGNFLFDVDEYKPTDLADGPAAIRFCIDEKGNYKLIFERNNGQKKIIAGQFLETYKQPGKTSFTLMGAITLGSDGTPSQEHPGAWREYTPWGTRREWAASDDTEDHGWGPWAYTNDIKKIWLKESAWKGSAAQGGWNQTKKDFIKDVTVKEGESWLGGVGSGIMKVPILSDVLGF